MTTRDINNNEAIQMLNRCKHEIQELRQTIAYLKPRADAYDNISTIIRIFFVGPQGPSGDDIIWTIQKLIDEMTLKPEANPTNANPVPTSMKKPKFDPDPYSAKPNEAPNAQPTARGYIDA